MHSFITEKDRGMDHKEIDRKAKYCNHKRVT